MKKRYQVSKEFKAECHSNFATNRQGRIHVIEDDIDIVGENYEGQLVSFTIEDDCYVNNKFIGTTVAKKITVNILNPDNEINLENKEISAFAGIEIDGVKEEIPFGNFIVEKTESKEVQSKTSFVGYDYMIKFNTAYKDTNTYPISLQEFFSNLCNQVGLEAGTEKIVNAEYEILGNPFTNKETCKTVLSAIAQLCGGFAKIGRDNKVHIITLANETKGLTVETVNLMTVEEVNEMLVGDATVAEALETIDGNNYDTTFKKNNVWGEVNSLIIRLSDDIEGENTVREDPDSITTNGLTEVTISGNEFLIDETEREKVIPELWENLKGIKYLPFSTDYYGYPYFDSGDKIKVLDNKDIEYDSYVLNHKFTYNGSFSGNITTEAVTKTQTQYKNIPDIKSKFRNVELKVDKINGQITSVIEEVNENTDKVSKMEQTVDEINIKVQNVADLTNTKNELKTITIEDAIEGPPIEIRIIGNNTVFDSLTLSDELYLDDDVVLGGDSDLKINDIIYDLGIDEVLRQYEDVYDEYIYNYTENSAKIIKRIGVDNVGNKYILSVEQIEELSVPNFQLVEGSNVITILNYSANMLVTYVVKNDYTNVFATKVEMNTEISQTAEEIKSEVSKEIITATGELEENISEISQTAEQIQSEVSKNSEDITKMSSTITQQAGLIEAKLDSDDFTSASIIALINNRDGTSTAKILATNIDLTGYVTATDLAGSGSTTINGANVKTGTISSDRLDTSTINATNGTIAGFTLTTENSLPILKGNNLGLAANSQVAVWLENSGTRTFQVQLTGEVLASALTLLSGHGFDHSGNLTCNSILVAGAPLIKTLAEAQSGNQGTETSRIYRIAGQSLFALDVNNSGTWTISANVPSDQKLKKNIENTDIIALDVINAIKFRQFDWKENGQHEEFGTVADELEKVKEKFVINIKQQDGSNLKTINRQEIIYYNSKAIQELSDKYDKLKKENIAYKIAIEELTKRIEKLENKEENVGS